MAERQDYVIASRSTDPDLAAVCTAVYDVIKDRTKVAHVDAFSDFDERMPADIRTVQSWLRRRSAEQTRHATGMGIKVYPDEDPGWAYAQAYTPWSIHVEIFDPDDKTIASFHDCGYSIIANLSAAEAEALAAGLPAHKIEPLLMIHTREREARRTARRERIRKALRLRR